MTTLHRGRAARCVASAVALAASSLLTLSALPAGATSKHTTPASCRPNQLQVTMSPPRGAYTASKGFSATLWFRNTGATCSLSVDNVPVQAVFGRSHAPIGPSSVSGDVAYKPIVLTNGGRADASVSIGSISTPAFKQMLRAHRTSCQPKDADGIEVVSNPAIRNDQWPTHYFALLEFVPVCTVGVVNVSAGVIHLAP